MSLQQINRSPDLKQLLEDGYGIAIKAGHLILYDVPYVDAKKEVKRGILVSTLEMADNVTVPPQEHVVMFTGDQPCDTNGQELPQLKHGQDSKQIAEGLAVTRSFSSKPKAGYKSYYEKMTTYAEMISSHARTIDPEATARMHRVVESEGPDDVFKYYDTASGRAGISAVTQKLELAKVGIIGLGGTGSYILDLLAKTPVKEIHLFDADDFLQHNAFRTPGAASSEELSFRPKKVDYIAAHYAPMRRGIIPHAIYLDETNLDLLDGMDFVFISIDVGEAKPSIIGKLETDNISFIDTGMGIHLVDDKLLGVVRTTASTETKRDHFKMRVPLSGGGVDDLYTKNIQIADLNALNAALAVIRWKKHFGFYADFENEHSSNYTLDGNTISNIDKP